MSKSINEDGVFVPAVSSQELEAAMKQASSDESEKVRMIAITMKKSSKVQIPVARGFKYVEVEPFGVTPEVSVEYAKRVTKQKKMNSRMVRPVLVWHIEPPKRPKNAKRSSFTTASGLKFNTDVYAPEEGLEIFGRKIYHSVSQAQHFIAKVLRTKAGIHRFITEFDTRPDVAAYGNYIISEKDREEREMLGVNARSLATV